MRPLRAFAIPAAAVLTLAVAAPVALQAQILDLTGTWNLELEATPPVVVEEAAARQAGPVLQPKGIQVDPCLYEGTVVATQDGDQWTGPAELSLVSEPDENCPDEMLGDLTGELTEDGGIIFITGFIDGGQLGHAIFDGEISPNPGGSGTMAVDEGPSAGTDGEWSAVLQQSVLEIPELTPVGMAILTLLLLAAGAWMLSRQAFA